MTIYLDNAASMPISDKVIKEISKANKRYYANPFSAHSLGIEARKALDNARKELTNEIGVKEEEIVFTSGGTESNALAILGVMREKKKDGKNKIIISCLEHSSVDENALALEEEGFIVKIIPASENEGIDLDFLSKEIDNKTGLVSICSVVSDIGIVNDVARVGKECNSKNVLFHVDHSQGFGKISLQPKNIGIDLLSVDAHKVGGPKGIGFLYVRNGVKVKSLFLGSRKERVLRPGTENVAGAIGFISAVKEYKKTDWKKVRVLRDLLQTDLEDMGARTTAKSLSRASSHLHVCFKDVSGQELVNYLSSKGIYCSTGSACDSEREDKRILTAIGIPIDYHKGAIRFSLSGEISQKDVKTVAKEIKTFLTRFKNA